MNSHVIVRLLVGIAILGSASSGAAQEAEDLLPAEADAVIGTTPDDSENADQSLWKYKLSLGAQLSLGASSNVIGAADGNTWTIGVVLDAGAKYENGGHDWRNSLLLSEAFTRTPVIDEFVKSADALALESLYLYHVPSVPWFGPFARFTLDTAILSGEDVRAADATYSTSFLDGTTEVVTASRLDLTDPFQPLTLAESVGVFVEPIDDDAVTVEILAGFGAQEIFAAGQLAIQDDADTAEIEVIELDDHNLAGLAALAKVYGAFDEGRVTYEAGAEVLVPFINSLPANDDRGAFDIANISFFAGVAFKMVEWASVDYRFTADQQPLLIDEWQMTHSLLLSFSYTFVDDIEGEE